MLTKFFSAKTTSNQIRSNVNTRNSNNADTSSFLEFGTEAAASGKPAIAALIQALKCLTSAKTVIPCGLEAHSLYTKLATPINWSSKMIGEPESA